METHPCFPASASARLASGLAPFAPVGFALVWLLQMKMRATPLELWKAVPIFVGIYIGTAFYEEFGFRGVLQQHLTRVLGPNGSVLDGQMGLINVQNFSRSRQQDLTRRGRGMP